MRKASLLFVVFLVLSLCIPAVSAGPLAHGEDLVSVENVGLDLDLVEAEPLVIVLEPDDAPLSDETEPTVMLVDTGVTHQDTINITPITESTNNLIYVVVAILPVLLIFGLIGRMKGWF